MSKLSVQGIIKSISDAVQVSDKFRKQDFTLVIDAQSQYPQTIQFQCSQDKCSILVPLNEGDQVIVHFNLRGRESNGKVWNTLDAWKIEKTNP